MKALNLNASLVSSALWLVVLTGVFWAVDGGGVWGFGLLVWRLWLEVCGEV